MASWKKVIVSGSDAELSSLTLDRSLIIQGPGVDPEYGTVFQTISSSYSDTFLSGSFKGVHDGSGRLLIDVTGSKVTVTACNSGSTSAKILFSAGTGTQAVCSDNDLNYNATSNTISGNITGNAGTATLATTATTATCVNLASAGDANSTHYIAFGASATGGEQLCTDGQITYNPSTNTLTVSNISGTVSNATCATCIKLTETDTNATYNLVFATSGAYADPRIDNQLCYNASSNLLTTAGAINAGGAVCSAGLVSAGPGSGAGTFASNGNQNVVLKTGNSTTGCVEIVDGAGGNISIVPNTTGKVVIGGANTLDTVNTICAVANTNLTLSTSATYAVCVTNDLNVGGDLIVAGDLAYLNVTNLAVEDRFILLNSGSSTGDGGIIVQNAATPSGSAFIFDDSEDRWGFTASLASSATTSTPDAYVPAVVTSDIAYYQKNGNIRIDGADIYIYS